ncbi:MAG: 3D domain-containing protein [Candidatus Eisenbacteria bacterium]|uniref:3D domain-containing protein n=1 Tax=Eiseniibacteriota bacterium TaxID=2212470 RepID=A0A956SDG3_UNCEI|nr:3D domain-containing protein [Candidatus Eisenbacteria bacterium]MCB9464977.1 3D domain-containing protein [Candidatus Eisenbacteria bacterium]
MRTLKPTERAHAQKTEGTLARPWFVALSVTAFVTAVGSLASREPSSIELLPIDHEWTEEAIGAIAYPPQVDDETPVWVEWLPSLAFVDYGPPAPADEEEMGFVFHSVSVTGYSSRMEETDSTPFITAINTITAPGVLAVSRDMLRTFTPGAPFDFGDRVLISGVGVYQIEDTMNPRWTRRVDVWFPSTEEALAWGRRETYMAIVDPRTPISPYEIPLALLAQEPIDLRHHSGLSTPWRILQ